MATFKGLLQQGLRFGTHCQQAMLATMAFSLPFALAQRVEMGGIDNLLPSAIMPYMVGNDPPLIKHPHPVLIGHYCQLTVYPLGWY